MDITEYIGIPQLTEINYTYWSVIMEATLASQGLWSIVSGDRPRATERFETKDDKQAKSSHERWDRDNAKAKANNNESIEELATRLSNWRAEIKLLSAENEPSDLTMAVILLVALDNEIYKPVKLYLEDIDDLTWRKL
ncbi:MAG: hypothetical protein M1824_001974 [Vezdaea acicularis]|nr:MAG: hypothetical protein M1824_001974 [Vezdaea acicularis]